MSVTCKHNWDVWECSCCMRTQEIWFVIQYLYSYACRGCRGLYPYPYLHSHNHNNFLKCRCSILIRHCHHPPPLLSSPTLHRRCHLTAPGDRPRHVLPSPPNDYNNNPQWQRLNDNNDNGSGDNVLTLTGCRLTTMNDDDGDFNNEGEEGSAEGVTVSWQPQ